MSIISSQLREEDRLLTLQQTGLLDSNAESIFDEQTKLLADVCGCPMAALSLVDRDRLYLKSKTGLNFCELDREGSFCEKVVMSGASVLVFATSRRLHGKSATTGTVPHYSGAKIHSGISNLNQSLATILIRSRSPCTARLMKRKGSSITARRKASQRWVTICKF